MAPREVSGSDPERDDRQLDRLALEAMPDDGRAVHPSDEAMLAYLHGQADEAQRAEVQRALLASRQFKRELLELAADLDRLDLEGARELYDAIPEPRHLASHALADRRWLRLNWIAGAAAAAAVALMILLSGRQPTVPAAPWVRLAIEIQPEVFVPVTPRGPAQEAQPYAQEVEAAVARFQEQVAWEDGSLRLQPPPRGLGPAEPAPLHLVQILGSDGRVVVEYPTGASVAYGLSTEPPRPGIANRAWLLSLPDLSLYNTPMEACTLRVSLPSPSVRRGCVTLTYPVRGGYLATEAKCFDVGQMGSPR